MALVLTYVSIFLQVTKGTFLCVNILKAKCMAITQKQNTQQNRDLTYNLKMLQNLSLCEKHWQREMSFMQNSEINKFWKCSLLFNWKTVSSYMNEIWGSNGGGNVNIGLLPSKAVCTCINLQVHTALRPRGPKSTSNDPVYFIHRWSNDANKKIRIINLSGCETWSLTLGDKHKL
jgi:hypothetical protein